MFSRIRLKTALKAAAAHLILSIAIAVFCAALVFGFWYPSPFDQLARGREIFLLVMVIDAVCGPLLTFIVFDRKKPRSELWRDLAIIGLIQISALGYGISSLMNARPVWIAFEGDRFRVVSVPDINLNQLHLAPESLQHLSLTGPKLLGVRLATNSDAEFKESIFLALDGVPPAFRPARWIQYEMQVQEIIKTARPLRNLLQKYPMQKSTLDKIAIQNNLHLDRLGYMPLLAEGTLEWTVIIGLEDGKPKAYLALDAWD
ncbi:TfpX/TfpZ family type IV pilin accessory protein [Acidovorax radicis]|nr:TfpX/TfpZ family type IV pilin accessory protein [Acidovorax radicis]